MSLRYGRLFDSTVRAEYERALTQAKAQLGPAPLKTRDHTLAHALDMRVKGVNAVDAVGRVETALDS
jgi:hypothetical protein